MLDHVQKVVMSRKHPRKPQRDLHAVFFRYKWRAYADEKKRATWLQMAYVVLLLIDLEEDLKHE